MSSYIGITYPDGATVFSGVVSSVGPGSAINTTGYDGLTVQVEGNSWSGIITDEGSNDNVVWYPLLVTKLSELAVKTQIDINGNWVIKADTLYVRYNVTNITGAVTLVILANANVISTAADRLALAMDETNNNPLLVKLQPQNSGIKQDLSGAFILSDAPAPVTVNLTATNNSYIIDTTGYQTIHLTTNTTFAATGGIAFSNDGITFVQAPMSTVPGVWSTAFVAVTNYTIPVQGRFARIIATTGGQFTYYLRNISTQVTHQNLAAIGGAAVAPALAQLGMNVVQVGGTAAVTGGLAGTLAVGGSVAAGVAPTTNPIIAGGIDPGGLTRRLFSDATGRLIINPYSLNVQVPSSLAGVTLTTSAGGNIAPVSLAGYNNQVPLAVQDTSQFEGQTQIELLAQILQEMKIMNQQLYELPRIIAGQLNGINTAGAMPIFTYGDEPTAMRNDASLFDKQQ